MDKNILAAITVSLAITAFHPVGFLLGIGALVYSYKKSVKDQELLRNEMIKEAAELKSKADEILNKQNSIILDAEEKARGITSEAEEKAKGITFEAETKLAETEKQTEYYINKNSILLQEFNTLNGNKLAAVREIDSLNTRINSLSHTCDLKLNQISEVKKELKHAKYILERYFKYAIPTDYINTVVREIDLLDRISPTVEINLKSLDYQDLRKKFQHNQRQINNLVKKYSDRYTQKTYQSIYELMVLALNAELQNILVNLKYDKLDVALAHVEEMIDKYIAIATTGNQTIHPTLLAFIGEVKIFYLEAVKIEYEYYIKKEKAREEQAMLREQMRQEAAERKLLEEQHKQILKEEKKYNTKIDAVNEQLNSATDESQIELLKAKLAELEKQLAEVNTQKEEIINLQNGKAGYVYVISNLGSFGDKMFKVGMTRRLNPQDRVDELGDASVPFKFDVHSFIFSEDAVGLEGALHRRLENQRVNKINIRKEFFYGDIDSMEKLVLEVDPTAEFNRTMLAEQYRQSLTMVEEDA